MPVEELAKRISAALPEDGRSEPLEGLHLHRRSRSSKLFSISTTGFCLVAQGSKDIFLADERYSYDTAHYLLVTSELPIMSQITYASSDEPFLSLRLELEPKLISSVMVEAGHASQPQSSVRAFNVSALDLGLLDAVLRLVRLLDTPSEAAFLAPLIKREIIFRLLRSEQGERLRQMATLGGHSNRMARAIERISKDYEKTLSIELIASDLRMSV